LRQALPGKGSDAASEPAKDGASMKAHSA
jgi:hypothetical protein